MEELVCVTDPLLNLHEILRDAADEAPSDVPAEVFTYRVPPALKAKVDEICKGNHTNASKFIRRVFYQLVKEYVGG